MIDEKKVHSELRSFVGQTAFEQISQQWVREKRKAGNLAFRPMIIGSHWSRKVQIDVVGVNWASRDILLGECKWGDHQIGRIMNTNACYLITINGRLEERLLRWFEGYKVDNLDNGKTLIVLTAVDQPALFGVLNRIRDLGLCLISVQRDDLPSI